MDLKKFEAVDIEDLPQEPINRAIPTGTPAAAPARPKAPAAAAGEDFQDPDAFMAGNVQRAPRNAAAAPQAAAQPNAPTPMEFAEQVMASRQESPTIKRLREAFGVKAPDGVIEEPLNGFKWTFRVPGSTDIQYAVALTQDIRDLEGDIGSDATVGMFTLALNRAFVAVSVSAIDDKPLYEHFGIEIPRGYMIPDTMNPPRHLRIRAAHYLYEMLSDETVDDLTAGLTEIYDRRVSPLVRRAKAPLVSTPPSQP